MSKLLSLPLPHLPSSFGKSHPKKFNVISAAATATVEAVPIVRDSSATPYQVLRVKPSASQAEIKAAYRRLAKLYHPDSALTNGDEGDFIEIHNAYAMLSDPTARARYDLSMRLHFSEQGGGSNQKSDFYASFHNVAETLKYY
ncbi:chaperone protein DnaJ-like [Rhodamnia argentea]|uniref:Chaperone protein DnaJ-like n=1 Tax=Rhodamnia argentea TaxID=178133 RepID=A0ABM3HW27_9MYRT|nr:chaperone protein DnaJ-like [Rhodamnia argentea]XP_048140817.1 chaperone protein DnaJ-like [Rhodamnia argentea]